ncbi:MAG: GNAT family N-acetyltransferase [bacterium]
MHADHDRLVEELRTWYTSSYPEMGYRVERQPLGFYGRNVNVEHHQTNQVTVRDLRPVQIPEFLTDLRTYYHGGSAYIYVDDPMAEALIGPSLERAGCSRAGTEVYLAHVGPVPRISSVAGLAIEQVTTANLLEYAVTKLKAFANSEAQPEPQKARDEVALRAAEMAGEGRFLLGRLHAEPAAIIGWYEGMDRYIFILATRVPFRGRGIAKALLCHALADGYAQGCRSVIINADPEDMPIQLYRRLGFTDEVYWRRCYRFDPATAPTGGP